MPRTSRTATADKIRHDNEVCLGLTDSTRKEGEVAWAEKSFVRLVELYQPIREYLTRIEAKRLAYAEKKVLSVLAAERRS